MLEVVEKLSVDETKLRHDRLRKILQEKIPTASGVLVFSSLNIYYLTGTLPSGVLWVPFEGEAVLFVRKGLERAVAETSIKHVLPLKSYSDIIDACASCSSPFGKTIGVEMSGLAWAMGNLLQSRIKGVEFIDASQVITKARSVKTEFELKKMRIAGAKHLESYEALATKVKPLMTEREIGILAFNEFLSREHSGILRMASIGAEAFLGQLSSGDYSNYPTYWDGPVGYIGLHPATPYMGSKTAKWEKSSTLVVDLGFSYQGYHTDKTQVFWSGSPSSLPDFAKKGHDTCVEIQNNAAKELVSGAIPEVIWQNALETAKKAGLAENFMATGQNQVKFLGHGIGLSYDEFPPLANRFTEPLEIGMTIAIEPKMGFKGFGMVGIENVYEITPNGAVSITGNKSEIICIE